MIIGALLLLILVAGIFTALRRAPETAPPVLNAVPAEGQLLRVDGTQVHVVEAGQGPALLFIHGASGNTREFTFALMDQLKDHFRVIAIDRPGHGYTGRIPTRAAAAESPAEQAKLINGTLNALGVERAIIAGQSYGGAVALAYALDFPAETSALVVISGVSNPWDTKLDAWYRLTNTWIGQQLVIPVVSKLATRQQARDTVSAIFAPDPVPDGYIEHIGVPLALRPFQMRANTQQINDLLPHIQAQHTRYGTLRMPVEILHGTADTTVPYHVHAAPLSTQIPHATVTALEGGGHMPQHSHQADVIEAIERAAKQAGLR